MFNVGSWQPMTRDLYGLPIAIGRARNT